MYINFSLSKTRMQNSIIVQHSASLQNCILAHQFKLVQHTISVKGFRALLETRGNQAAAFTGILY